MRKSFGAKYFFKGRGAPGLECCLLLCLDSVCVRFILSKGELFFKKLLLSQSSPTSMLKLLFRFVSIAHVEINSNGKMYSPNNNIQFSRGENFPRAPSLAMGL